MLRHLRRLLGLLTILPAVWPLRAGAASVDVNLDGLGDLWQLRFGAQALAPSGDADGDGLNNGAEALAGTDPFAASSALALELTAGNSATDLRLRWPALRDKFYVLEQSSDLVNWSVHSSHVGRDAAIDAELRWTGVGAFARVGVSDLDSDGDGVTDWEERLVGFDPRRVFSEGFGSNPANPTANNPRITDLERFKTQLAATTNTVSIVAVEPQLAEGWPHPAVAIVRRTGKWDALTVAFALEGSATAGQDYVAPAGLQVTIPFGADQAVVVLDLLPDDVVEGPETLTLRLAAGSGYTVDAAAAAATFSVADAAEEISTVEATRFLQQATFGPTAAELTRVRTLGYAAWLDEQFARPIARHLPIVQTWYAERNDGTVNDNNAVSVEHRIEAFWRQTMRDDASSDPLRQRVAFALSQIFVVSDRMSSLNNDQRGMADYYDTLLTHAFGSYRQLLEAVTRHPWMGLYLSALRNRKADPALNRFPDENYAREVLQLFSIGLWRLNPDGTHYLSNGTDLDPDGNVVAAGLPIATYGQTQVSVFARVFTGMSYSQRFSGTTNATEIPTTGLFNGLGVPWRPMRMFDSEHDVAAKQIWLPGAPALALPARTNTSSSSTASGDADLAAALDYIAAHPNVGPFICRQLIQRLVTSNPTPAYVARVVAAFADNGSSVRGDLRAVLRAVLLDPEARDFASTQDPQHGQLREPYTRYVAAARALGVAPRDASAGGRYRNFGGIDAFFLQRPLSAPSVFNFYQPDYAPPGAVREAGLVAPEFQILNSVSAITGPNRFSDAFNAGSSTSATRFNSSGISDDPATPTVNEALWNSAMDESGWLPLARNDVDGLVAALARTLCARPLRPETFRAITRALRRMSDPMATGDLVARDQRASHRLRVAAHLITLSPECAVLR